jgi:hypothetical protein
MLLFYEPVVSADDCKGHSTMVLPTPSIALKAAEVPGFRQIFMSRLRLKNPSSPANNRITAIVADLLNRLYQNGFYMNSGQGHRIRSANTAND